MNEDNLYLLLDIIKKNGNVKKLIHNGLSYKAIAELTTWAITNEYLLIDKNEIFLSQKGTTELTRLSTLFKKNNKEEWIVPEIESKIKPIEKDFIYLPNRNELSF
ncbi:MAG: hypothetical protein NVSMB24_10000 [Mucilaginibacter sp.]